MSRVKEPYGPLVSVGVGLQRAAGRFRVPHGQPQVDVAEADPDEVEEGQGDHEQDQLDRAVASLNARSESS